MASSKTALLIALGGAIGTVARWALSVAFTRARWDAFPWATLAVNVLGSFALGIVVESLEGKRIFGADARLVFGTGVMGGFTTYSTFNLETLRMLERGEHGRAAAYAGITLLACACAGVGGIAIGRAFR